VHVELGTIPHVKVRQQRYKGVVKALKTTTANRDVLDFPRFRRHFLT
jgi:hypothetical protein